MPRGKAHITGGPIKRPHNKKEIEAIFLSTLLQEGYFIKDRFDVYESAKQQTLTLSEYSAALNELMIYLGRHNGYAPNTETEINQYIKKLSTASRRLLESLEEENKKKIDHWNDKLLSSLCLQNSNIKDKVHKYLLRRNMNIYDLQKELSNYPEEPLSKYIRLHLEVLVNIDIQNLEGYGRYYFVDPYLFDLVKAMSPFWKNVTGRTALPTNIKREDEKTHPFADWICTMVYQTGGIKITENAVLEALAKF